MNREYYKWYSPTLGRQMELLVFGHKGTPVLFFPTRTARFYDYENWKVIDAVADKINNGWLQLYCVDSVDIESFYNKSIHPSQRMQRHMQYERYIIQEVLPLIWHKNENRFITAAGCSLGAYHSVNIALKHPTLFSRAVGMSGRYDLTLAAKKFPDLFDGYRDENIYFNMPTQYIVNLTDHTILEQLRNMHITMAVGQEDPFLHNNKYLHWHLLSKQVCNELHIWNGEAHRAIHWQQMVKCYL
jgi:esterase/lipase superfamily enzyme